MTIRKIIKQISKIPNWCILLLLIVVLAIHSLSPIVEPLADKEIDTTTEAYRLCFSGEVPQHPLSVPSKKKNGKYRDEFKACYEYVMINNPQADTDTTDEEDAAIRDAAAEAGITDEEMRILKAEAGDNETADYIALGLTKDEYKQSSEAEIKQMWIDYYADLAQKKLEDYNKEVELAKNTNCLSVSENPSEYSYTVNGPSASFIDGLKAKVLNVENNQPLNDENSGNSCFQKGYSTIQDSQSGLV